MKKKLTGLKSNVLNMIGRTVLVESSLVGIPSHVMSYIKLLENITKSIDKITMRLHLGFCRG